MSTRTTPLAQQADASKDAMAAALHSLTGRAAVEQMKGQGRG